MDMMIRQNIILHERILGLVLFHLFMTLSGIVYMAGKDTVVDITLKMIQSYNHTIKTTQIKGNDHWIYGNIIVSVNTILSLCISITQYIQYMFISSLEILLMSFEYGILTTSCVCMIIGTITTFLCMKVYRSDVEIGLFGIKIRN